MARLISMRVWLLFALMLLLATTTPAVFAQEGEQAVEEQVEDLDAEANAAAEAAAAEAARIAEEAKNRAAEEAAAAQRIAEEAAAAAAAEAQKIAEEAAAAASAAAEVAAKEAESAIEKLKTKIGSCKDAVITGTKSAVDKVKGLSGPQKKKAGAAVVAVWGGLAAVGWVANNAGNAPPPAKPVKKGRK
ncbi:MAG: hypothetical protein SGBAC_006661 [Bacillariaceae sp.]